MDKNEFSAELIEIAHALEGLMIRLDRTRRGTTDEQDQRIHRIALAGYKVAGAARKMGNNLR